MCVACLCVHMKLPIFLWCTFDTTLIILPSFMKIRPHLPEIWRFVFCPKLCARFHVLCMHVRTCTCTNIINQFRRPILNYTEGFMKIWLHLADILRFVTTLKKCYFCEDLGKKRKKYFCGHFGAFPDWKWKWLLESKSFVSSIPIWSAASFFSFSVRKGFKMAAKDI